MDEGDFLNYIGITITNIEKQANEAHKKSEIIIARICEALSDAVTSVPSSVQLQKNENKCELVLTLFGNNILIKAEVSLSDPNLINISTYLIKSKKIKDDEKVWLRPLSSALSFDSDGLTKYDKTYEKRLNFKESARVLFKSLIEELKEKKITVKRNPPAPPANFDYEFA